MTTLNAVLAPIVEQTAPALVALTGVGVNCASALLVAAGAGDTARAAVI